MTLRARSSGPRPRFNVERGDRRNALVNLGFTLVVAASLLLLAVAAGLTWYNAHLVASATIDGQSITKDDANQQAAVDLLRIQLNERALKTRRVARTIRESDFQAQMALLGQEKSNIESLALEHLIDSRLQARLASEQGITVTDADVTAKLNELATIPELRHAWIVEVAPEVTTGATGPTDQQKADARRKADEALADIKAGKSWDEVARSVSTSSTKSAGGDVGFVDDKAPGLDAKYLDAVFVVQPDVPTDVIVGEDGTYRIGRVTQIIPKTLDPDYEQKVIDKGVSLAAFRSVVRSDVVKDKLEKAVVARVSQVGPQRHVLEIFMRAGQSETKTGAIRTKHILYAPKDDPQGAGSLDANDPAWAAAEKEARAAYDLLKADPSKFDAVARQESDEGGAAESGGKLPYFASDDSIDPAFAGAIFKPGLTDGQLLEPVKSSFGWHVILIWHHPTDLDWAKKLKGDLGNGADFATVARDNSEGPEAKDGGDLGWVPNGLLPQVLNDAIFATPIGSVSEPIVVPEGGKSAADPGVYLIKVVGEENRAPDADEKTKIEKTAFSTWYTEQKAKATITRGSPASTDQLTQ